MIVAPKVRGFICTTAHPVGCAVNVSRQIEYVRKQGSFKGKKKVLVIGASTGYGLASRIVASFGSGAKTIGVFFEKGSSNNRTASPGWYNTVAFEKAAKQSGIYAKSINGDAFSNEIKEEAIELIKQDWNGEVDLIIYSLASPRRIEPVSGQIYNSVLKPIGAPFTSKTLNVLTKEISEISIEPATEVDIQNTVKVMGGEDWSLWIDALKNAGVLSEGAMTVAYSYIGPDITYPVYRNGTIGKAKEHLEQTAKHLHNMLQKNCNGSAFISVNKGLVTQASSAIPVVPLYISILYRVMKELGIHEGCIEQIYRLFADRLFFDLNLDSESRIRIDDWEMREDVQKEVLSCWNKINTENLEQLADLEGYRKEFYNLFGFDVDGVCYGTDVDVEMEIPSLFDVSAQA